MTNASGADTPRWVAVGIGLAVGWLGFPLNAGAFNISKIGWNFGERQVAQALKLSAVDIRPQWESAWVREVIANDPAVKQIVSGYLSGLSSAGYALGEQGVWVSTGQYTVAQNQGNIPMPAASLTKVATTLSALSTWEAAHRFETWIGWEGQFENGVVIGDLVVEGGGDPLFVWEEAIALGNALSQLGVRRVTGNLIIAGDFTMNFEISTSQSGELLKQALNASQWDYAIESAHSRLAPGTPTPAIQIEGGIEVSPTSRRGRASGWLLRHDSLPLVAILKAMNIYSNNPMAEHMASIVGGPASIVQKAEEVAGVVPGELTLINGSGLGEENQMSPRAAVAMLQKIHDILRQQNLTISDIFPIAGRDGGTLVDRGLPNNAVVKTGSLAVVSALAGALPTQKKGLVWFSLINYGLGLDALRDRQDQILLAIEHQWGKATEIPPELQSSIVIGQPPYQFGDPQRNRAAQQPAP
ncbi:MAG: D-alanyl-D-alanine carboxypeptidase [Cyanobacteria bacterium J06554_11]